MPLNQALEISEGAIMVADAHHASYRPFFKEFLLKIKNDEIQTSQLILLGDNVDILVGKISFFEKHEKDLIDLLNELSKSKDIIYFEGNHDFKLKSLFPNIRVIPLKEQPLQSSFKDHQGWLAHGDWDEGLAYSMFTYLLRSRPLLFVYELIDRLSLFALSRFLRQKMRNKKLCQSFDHFETKIANKLASFRGEGTWLVEGHYHQGVELDIKGLRYINLDAMACNKSYFVVQSIDNEFVLAKCKL